MHGEVVLCETRHTTGHLNIKVTFLAIWFYIWQFGSNIPLLFVPRKIRSVQLLMAIWNRPRILSLLITGVVECLLDG